MRPQGKKEQKENRLISPYLACLLLVGTALAQTTLSPRLAILGVQPNVVLLVVLSWSMLQGGREGMLWGFGGGVFLDLLSGAPFGTSALSLLLVGFLAGLGEASVFRTSLSFPLIVSFASSLLHDVVFLAILWVMGWTVDWATSLWRLVLPAAVLNTALMPLVYGSLGHLHRRANRADLAW